MKRLIIAISLVPACLLLACGTKKDEKHLPVAIEEASADATNPEVSQPLVDCPAELKCDPEATEARKLTVIDQDSWLNPEFDADGRLTDHEGRCLNEIKTRRADDEAISRLDMNLELRTERSGSRRCQVELKVAYKQGYAFAIRKIEVPLSGRIPVDSEALFEGSYGFKGKKGFAVNKALDSRVSAKPLRLDYTVVDRDIVWSGCSGEATLVVDTELSLNFKREAQRGELRIEGNSPYRLEVVWAQCQ